MTTLTPAPVVNHAGDDDIPWVDTGIGIDLKVLRCSIDSGVWVVRNRFQPGVRIPRHRHTGPVEGFTLTMSWACFCAKFGCTDREPACASNRATYPGCGLTTDNFNTVAGPTISVWDESGALVGRQYVSDTTYYQCPSDPSLEASRVRAGRFPDATCSAVGCTCTGGTTTCSSPDAGADAQDGGGADARDGGADASCSGPAIGCTVGSAGGQCSDAGQPAVCLNGQWTCQPPTNPFSQCACIGAPRPGCTCTSSGWSCPADGGGDH